MDKHINPEEMLSALADGELAGADIEQALSLCAEDEVRRWQSYHVIGDVLRAPALARCSDSRKLLEGIRAAVEDDRLGTLLAVEAAPVPMSATGHAVNDSVFRWKMVAGFASLAAVAAIGWNSFGELRGAGVQGPQLASAVPDARSAPDVPNLNTLQASASGQVMIRDPRLDELLAAHRKFGSANALQMPAGFLRNATFETPQQ